MNDPTQVSSSNIIDLALVELERRIADRFGADDPVVELLEVARAGSDRGLVLAALAAGRFRLGEPPCECCRRSSPSVVVPIHRACKMISDPSDAVGLAILGHFERAGLVNLEDAVVKFTKTAEEGLHSPVASGLRWMPDAPERVRKALS